MHELDIQDFSYLSGDKVWRREVDFVKTEFLFDLVANPLGQLLCMHRC